MRLRRSHALHDIADCEAFIEGTIRKKCKMIAEDEMDEYVAEGFALLYWLHGLYDPERDVPNSDPDHVCVSERCCKPSFAGYASFVLPKKLNEAWYRNHEEWAIKKVDGKKTYVKYETAASYDFIRGSQHDAVEIARKPGEFVAVPVVPKEDT